MHHSNAAASFHDIRQHLDAVETAYIDAMRVFGQSSSEARAARQKWQATRQRFRVTGLYTG